ncbi:PepSY domain-containing protein [uncultured Fenollaria sp.]|uniref:PepSY domain-containing protein n=1 Tax=uncultured Fenollaria sp. TaxID=1686315 RepID=UPI0025FBAAC0|nr:PepSY domain-containing protein [uncultured Fenollaria sp.]
MKKTILILALVLSLALVGCQGPSAPATMDETDQSKMQDVASEADTAGDDAKTDSNTATENAITLSAEDAVKIFNDKYANVNIDEISFEKDNGVYAYEINGFDDANEYELEVNAADGSIIKEKSEKDNTADKKAIDLGLIKNIDELVATSIKDAGDGYHLNSFSIEHEAGITKLDIEVEDANGKDIEYEYNLETKELIKKDL